MSTIGDRVANVVELLGGRTDKATQISQWLASGYRDIGSTIPFETLEATANVLCVSGIDSYDYPEDARGIKSLTMGIPASSPTSFPPLRKRNMAILDRYTTVTGVPSIWAPFNSQFFLRAVPNDAYPITVRYWQKVTLAVAADGTTDINSTVLNVPDDWLEIIDYEAQMRGYMDLQEFDKAGAIRTLLYGNPRKPGMPGLIKQRLTRIQAESENADYGLRPRKSRYTNCR